MSSEVDSSIFTPTIGSTENIESKSRRGISAHTTWAHTRKPKDEEPEKIGKSRILYCKYCESYSAQSTGAFRNHLSKEHKIEVTVQKGKIQDETLHQL